MLSRPSRTLCGLALALLSACASHLDPQPASVIENIPTPTPFQPGKATLPSGAWLTPSAVATFTPYPLAQPPGNAAPTPRLTALPSDFPLPEINPLTGLPASDPTRLHRRPLAIKVANYPRYVRPQSGLSLADVVFEYYIEDLLTRFIAIFYGNDARQVGPVRSGRYFDEHVARMYQAFYVFKYADPREYVYFIRGDFARYVVVPGFGPCPPFLAGKRGIESYNNAYFDTTRWEACAAQQGLDNVRPSLRGGFFRREAPAGGFAVQRIFTYYSVDDYNYWEYDPAGGRYLRYQEANDRREGRPASYAPLLDDLTGQQVTASNVVVLFVSHTFANEFEQEDEIYHINLVDSGYAFVFRDGLAFPSRWQRTDIDQPLLFTTLEGLPMYFKPGTTFYQVLGETSRSWSDGADWHFEFRTP